MYSSLYIHVPYCAAKCDYCAFYSVSDNGQGHDAYLSRLEEECRVYSSECEPLQSIFIGGGTPSMLSSSDWLRLNAIIKNNFTLAPNCEFTTEANPESITREHVDAWKECGINRVSMGIQSFDEKLRSLIGRRGTLAKLNDIINWLDDVAITRRNFDFIFNLPGQTPDIWTHTLQHALDFNPTHISTYELTIEEGTPLHKRNFNNGGDDAFFELWNISDEVLGNAGMRRYEISNFALPGEECRHNLEIWKGATYLGCGPAAWSFDGLTRRGNVKSIDAWLSYAAPEIDTLSPEERAAEILAFGMRTADGWDWDDFHTRTGFDALQLRAKQLQHLASQGLITLTQTGAAPTKQGLFFNDTILSELI